MPIIQVTQTQINDVIDTSDLHVCVCVCVCACVCACVCVCACACACACVHVKHLACLQITPRCCYQSAQQNLANVYIGGSYAPTYIYMYMEFHAFNTPAIIIEGMTM